MFFRFFFAMLIVATGCRIPEPETVYVYVEDPDAGNQPPMIIFESPRGDPDVDQDADDGCDPFQFNWIDGPYETTSQPIARTIQSDFFAREDGAEQSLLFTAERGCGEGYFVDNMLITIDADWIDREERGLVTVVTSDGELHDEELVVFIVEDVNLFVDTHEEGEIVIDVSPELTENMIPDDNGDLATVRTMIQWTDAETGNAMHEIMENSGAWDDKGQTFSFLREI